MNLAELHGLSASRSSGEVITQASSTSITDEHFKDVFWNGGDVAKRPEYDATLGYAISVRIRI